MDTICNASKSTKSSSIQTSDKIYLVKLASQLLSYNGFHLRLIFKCRCSSQGFRLFLDNHFSATSYSKMFFSIGVMNDFKQVKCLKYFHRRMQANQFNSCTKMRIQSNFAFNAYSCVCKLFFNVPVNLQCRKFMFIIIVHFLLSAYL